MAIIKRDGRTVEFDKNKIINAILKAFEAVDGEVTKYAREKSEEIAEHIELKAKTKDLAVEDIQDVIEKYLMSSKRKDVARAFITYREQRSIIREKKMDWMKLIVEKTSASDVQNQNANVDENSFGGRKGEADSVLMKKLALDYCMSPKSRENHLNNEIYIHDLDSYAIGMTNCLTVPIDGLLAKGFNTRQTDVRPANSINTAFQLLAVLFQLQSLQQFG